MALPPSAMEGTTRVNNDDHALAEDELYAAMSHDMNSWSSRVNEPFITRMQSEITTDVELQDLIRYFNRFEEYEINGSTSPNSFDSIPGATPLTHSEHRSYSCSWKLLDSAIQCNQVVHGRLAFLRHLGMVHQASGSEDATIICRLLDSKTGSTCSKVLKRGNLPRHVDTHYPLCYHCHYCPAGKFFSRRDSWKKHIRSKHPQSPPAS